MEIEVLGFGLAGACLAIQLKKLGISVKVIDDGLAGSSQVAAGLVNPVAGRNFEPSWRFTEFWDEALAFYSSIDASLFHPHEIFRRWMNDDDRKKFEKKRQLVAPWIKNDSEEGVTWGNGGWLEVSRFIEVARQWMKREGVIFGESQGALQVHCTGSLGLRRKDFEGIEHRCAKGEILTLRIPDWDERRILTGGGWLIPIAPETYRVGATYTWDGFDAGPTKKGRDWILRMVKIFTDREVEILDHVAGVRPIIRRSQPVVHYEEGRGWMFNGLGSKGVIYAPGVARKLASHLVEQVPLDPELSM